MAKPIVLIAEELSPATVEALGSDFDIRSVGRGPRNAQSEHVQSFYVVGRAL